MRVALWKSTDCVNLLGGGWNPCLGPDTFQRCVAYWFGWHQRFDKHRPLREVQLHDIVIGGERAYAGLEGERLRRRVRGATAAWFRLMSHTIQEEASRRVRRIEAQILVESDFARALDLREDRKRRRMDLVDRETERVVRMLEYRLNRFTFALRNAWRHLGFGHYGGGGPAVPLHFPRRFAEYLVARHQWAYQLLAKTREIRVAAAVVRHPFSTLRRVPPSSRYYPLLRALLRAEWARDVLVILLRDPRDFGNHARRRLARQRGRQ